MKELDQMTHEEILKLSDSDVERLMDWECAREGIKLIDMPTEPEKKTFEFDTKVTRS